jgi:hypothetical protein
MVKRKELSISTEESNGGAKLRETPREQAVHGQRTDQSHSGLKLLTSSSQGPSEEPKKPFFEDT